MSDTAARLPAEDKWGHRLHGVVTGNETVELPGERVRYLE